MLKYLVFTLLLLVVASEAAKLNKKGRKGKQKDCTPPEECKTTPLDIAFVVDASSSIWQGNFTLGLNFIENFVDMFRIGQDKVRFSLVTYGAVVYTQDAFGFGDYSTNDELKKAVASVPYRGGSKTNTSGGIWYMLRHQMPEAREDVRKIAVVMTDGNSQERHLTMQAAKDAHDAGLEVFAVGIGHDMEKLEPEELHAIASDSRHVFRTDSYDQLEYLMKRLAYETCDVRPYPGQPKHFKTNCQMDPVDLSFVIDSSASIGEGNFTVGMHFVRDFVDSFLINPASVRVSAVTYARDVYTDDAFGFRTYDNKKDVLDALLAIKWKHGDYTSTGNGIRHMRDHQMSQARPQAAHVCIVITDGESQDKEYTAEQARIAQNQGIIMYAVGVGKIGKELNEDELNNIAGDPSRVMTSDNYSQLNLLKIKLTDITCTGIVELLGMKAASYRQ